LRTVCQRVPFAPDFVVRDFRPALVHFYGLRVIRPSGAGESFYGPGSGAILITCRKGCSHQLLSAGSTEALVRHDDTFM
jgi:hypothetical protein